MLLKTNNTLSIVTSWKKYKCSIKTQYNIGRCGELQYIPRNMHMVFALLCFVVVIHWLIFPYPSGLLFWHCGNLTIAPVPAKQPWWIWINTSCEFIMNNCITTTKQSTTKPCAYFLGYTVCRQSTNIIVGYPYDITVFWLPHYCGERWQMSPCTKLNRDLAIY